MYKIENPMDRALTGMNSAGNSYARMTQDIPANRDPGPSVGGGLMAGMGGAAMGAQVGSMMATPAMAAAGGLAAVGGPITLGIGAALGIGSYLFS